MKCPNCGLHNPPSAMRCDCGYNFQEGKMALSTQEGTMELPERQAKRPKLVWAITIFYIISVPFMLLSFFLVLIGQVPLSPAMQAYFDSLTALDYSLTTLLAALNIAGAVSLFRLHKSAVWLFAVGLGLNGFLTLSHMLTTNWMEAMAETGAGGVDAVTLLIALGIPFYAWWLKQKGVLT